MLHSYRIQTKEREGFYNITRQVASAVLQSGVQEGLCVIQVPHTTAGITVNENADPDVVSDMKFGFRKAFPESAEYHHMEGNTTAHLKCTTVGATQTVIISGGKLLLGMWQGIYFCEFDGPRNRTYYVKIIEG